MLATEGEVRYLIVGKVHGKYIMAIMAPSSGRLRIFSGREPSEEYKELYRKK